MASTYRGVCWSFEIKSAFVIDNELHQTFNKYCKRWMFRVNKREVDPRYIGRLWLQLRKTTSEIENVFYMFPDMEFTKPLSQWTIDEFYIMGKYNIKSDLDYKVSIGQPELTPMLAGFSLPIDGSDMSHISDFDNEEPTDYKVTKVTKITCYIKARTQTRKQLHSITPKNLPGIEKDESPVADSVDPSTMFTSEVISEVYSDVHTEIINEVTEEETKNSCVFGDTVPEVLGMILNLWF